MSGWTKEQLSAITARNTGIIVSAAAGSGKTSVLVERLLGILSDTENKIPADRIVVVTFTNDAAAQMKQRLSAALSEAIEKDPDNLWLCRQQALLQTAKISTIHSFCFDLIRENIRSLDVSAGFRILDDTEEKLLVRKAAENTFEKLYGEVPDKINALADFFSGRVRDDGELEEAMLKIYDFLMSVPFYEDWLKGRADYYSAGFNPEGDPLAAAYADITEKRCGKILRGAAYAQSLFEETFGRPSKALASDIEGISEIAAEIENGGVWGTEDIFGEFEFARFDFPRRGKNDPIDELAEAQKEKIKKLREDYKKEFAKLGENSFTAEEIGEDYEKHAEILRGISEVISVFAEELKKLKTAKNALGFSDAEQLAIKLLAEKNEDGEIVKTRLARELSEYYSMIMIDEFQDANNNQDLIFKLLSKGGTAEKGGENLFVVGDVKQSIYRFRLANPRLFTEVLGRAESYTGEDFSGDFAAVLLNRNFRSGGDVIGFVNFVFGLLMSKENGEIDYTAEEALVQGLEYPEGDRTTEIIIVPDEGESNENTENTEKDDGEDGDGDEISPSCEARAAARKIKSMIGVKTVFDKGVLRPCEPRDFCILLRNNKSGEMYVRELERAGVKAYAEEPAGYLKSREISVVTALLAGVDNPMQDIPLVTALMSPMFMLNAEDMAVLAGERIDGREKYFGVIRRVIGGETSVESGSPLRGKLERFMKMYEKLRYCAASQRIERFIRTIYDSTDFLSAVQVYKDGGRKRANLRLLLDVAESYEKNSEGGLSGFVRYVDSIIKRGGDFRR
ncbi:MAG: UvrD-helicase domain-containing protein, partial [Muribaculaceae bacterium]|nr:UvrD-helicase domain-containing protein [Muribaculaceae bacterium]